MNKKILFIILAVILILIGVYYYKKSYKSDVVSNVQDSPLGLKTQSIPSIEKNKPQTSSVKTVPKKYVGNIIVNLKDSGPQPRSLDISKGDTVKFINNGTRPFWVASDPHPLHNLCPGFDSVHGLVHNESWSYTFKFDAPKICSYHNHIDPTTTLYSGVINIVK